MSATLTEIDLDWTDFEEAGRRSRRHLLELAADRERLSALLRAAEDDPALLGAGAHGASFDRIPLQEVAGGSRLELHVAAVAPAGAPRPQDFSFSKLILRGGYQHTWYGQGGEEPVPFVTRFEQPGSCYSVRRGTAVATAPAEDTVALVLRGPAADDAAEGDGTAEEISVDRCREMRARLERLGVLGSEGGVAK